MATRTARQANSSLPDAAAFHRRLDDLLPLVEAKAQEAENLGRMTDEVVAEYIAKVQKRGAIGKKRKSARC